MLFCGDHSAGSGLRRQTEALVILRMVEGAFEAMPQVRSAWVGLVGWVDRPPQTRSPFGSRSRTGEDPGFASPMPIGFEGNRWAVYGCFTDRPEDDVPASQHPVVRVKWFLADAVDPWHGG